MPERPSVRDVPRDDGGRARRCARCAARGRCSVVLHPVAVHYKGSGFYSTDYGRKSKQPAKDSGGSEGSGSGSEGGGSGGSGSSGGSGGSGGGSGDSGSGRASRAAAARRPPKPDAGIPLLPGEARPAPPGERLEREQQHDRAHDREQERAEVPAEAAPCGRARRRRSAGRGSAPTIPTATVGMQPIAWRPGVTARATRPATSPKQDDRDDAHAATLLKRVPRHAARAERIGRRLRRGLAEEHRDRRRIVLARAARAAAAEVAAEPAVHRARSSTRGTSPSRAARAGPLSGRS